ncbi:MAG: hypothetical protein JWQ35_2494 [Bacteriovoracaceae bacterium]|nr:hypothetical protein [Bacteriovoracaceae bacterium]
MRILTFFLLFASVLIFSEKAAFSAQPGVNSTLSEWEEFFIQGEDPKNAPKTPEAFLDRYRNILPNGSLNNEVGTRFIREIRANLAHLSSMPITSKQVAELYGIVARFPKITNLNLTLTERRRYLSGQDESVKTSYNIESVTTLLNDLFKLSKERAKDEEEFLAIDRVEVPDYLNSFRTRSEINHLEKSLTQFPDLDIRKLMDILRVTNSDAMEIAHKIIVLTKKKNQGLGTALGETLAQFFKDHDMLGAGQEFSKSYSEKISLFHDILRFRKSNFEWAGQIYGLYSSIPHSANDKNYIDNFIPLLTAHLGMMLPELKRNKMGVEQAWIIVSGILKDTEANMKSAEVPMDQQTKRLAGLRNAALTLGHLAFQKYNDNFMEAAGILSSQNWTIPIVQVIEKYSKDLISIPHWPGEMLQALKTYPALQTRALIEQQAKAVTPYIEFTRLVAGDYGSNVQDKRRLDLISYILDHGNNLGSEPIKSIKLLFDIAVYPHPATADEWATYFDQLDLMSREKDANREAFNLVILHEIKFNLDDFLSTRPSADQLSKLFGKISEIAKSPLEASEKVEANAIQLNLMDRVLQKSRSVAEWKKLAFDYVPSSSPFEEEAAQIIDRNLSRLAKLSPTFKEAEEISIKRARLDGKKLTTLSDLTLLMIGRIKDGKVASLLEAEEKNPSGTDPKEYEVLYNIVLEALQLPKTLSTAPKTFSPNFVKPAIDLHAAGLNNLAKAKLLTYFRIGDLLVRENDLESVNEILGIDAVRLVTQKGAVLSVHENGTLVSSESTIVVHLRPRVAHFFIEIGKNCAAYIRGVTSGSQTIRKF